VSDELSEHETTESVPLPDMEVSMETILIIVLLVLLLGGGGWYGRGRWYGRRGL
jgi:hypothetical protein